MGYIENGDNEQTPSTENNALARGIAKHGAAFAAWADIIGIDFATEGTFEDCFLGKYDSSEAFAEEMLADLGLIDILDELVPNSLRCYVDVDVEGFARDLELGGDIDTVPTEDGGVWVFRAL